MSRGFHWRVRERCQDRVADVVWTYDAGRHVTGFIWADTSEEQRLWIGKVRMREPGDVDDVWLRPSSLGHLDRLINDENEYVEEHSRESPAVLGAMQVIVDAEDPRDYVEVRTYC